MVLLSCRLSWRGMYTFFCVLEWARNRTGLTTYFAQGGFARVYEVQDQKKGRRAVKVVSKASIRTKKNKTKASVALPESPTNRCMSSRNLRRSTLMGV